MANLKPKTLHTHFDKAEKLGVPRSNIVDLRAQSEQAAMQQAQAQHAIATPVDHVPAEQLVEQYQAEAPMKKGWFARWRAQRNRKRNAQYASSAAAHVAPVPAQLPMQEVPAESTAQSVNVQVHASQTQQHTVPQPAELPALEDMESDEVALPAEPEQSTIFQPQAEVEDVFAVFEEQAAAMPVTQKTQRKRKRRPAKRSQRRVQYNHPFGEWLVQLRPVVAFVLVCAIIIAPLATTAFFVKVNNAKNEIITVSQEAVDQLKTGGNSIEALSFTQASGAFAEAANNFEAANTILQKVNGGFAPLVKSVPELGPRYESAENILIAGEYLSEAATDMANAFTLLQNMQGRLDVGVIDNVEDSFAEDSEVVEDSTEDIAEEVTEDTDVVEDGAQDIEDSVVEEVDESTQALQVTDMLVLAHAALRPAAPKIERAALALQDVNPDHFPAEYQSVLREAKALMPIVTSSVRELLELNESLITILGHNETKRYLVLFQNNRELRPTGGFLGSFAVVEIANGKVQNIDIPGGGTYDLQGGFRDSIVAPDPLHLVNPYWYIQDANWWPDFAISAQKVQWFYKKSGGGPIDGVIALTPEVIEQMLEASGPIDMPEYAGTVDKTEDGIDVINGYVLDENYRITADNFYWVTQAQAERKFDDTNNSKQFIADLTPKLLNQLLSNADNFVPVLQTFQTALEHKDIQIYMNDPYIQEEMRARGWTGEIQQTDGDYLYVVHTNIAGGKTDTVMNWSYQHEASIAESGSITDSLVITGTHEGSTDSLFENVRNQQYVRVYVPKGSILTSADIVTQPIDQNLMQEPDADAIVDEDLQAISGDVTRNPLYNVDVSEEFGKTVYGFWLATEPGSTSTASLQYRLPFSINTHPIFSPADTYSLFVQKQAGLVSPLFSTEVKYPASLTPTWSYPDGSNGATYQLLEDDFFTGVVLQQ